MTARCAQLVLLDVDCIPSNDLVQRYCEGMQAFSTTGPDIPRVLCGEVLYLPPLPEEVRPSDPARLDTARTHPARPVLASGTTQTEKDLTLFWSLSFATTTAHWYTLGGFDEAFVGYGGEDTDFGQRLRQAGGEMVWIGGPVRTTSTTRWNGRPCNTSRTSCATPTCSRRDGDGGRWRGGSRGSGWRASRRARRTAGGTS